MESYMDRQAKGSSAQPGDISITGESSWAGGEYRKVKVVGDSTFNGATRCRQFKCTGTSVVKGSLDATEIKVTGTLALVAAEDGGRAQAPGNETTASGRESQYDLKAEEVKVLGELHVAGNCQAERIRLTGRIEVGGMLSAEQLSIQLKGSSRVHEIGGSRIEIGRGRGRLIQGLLGQHAVATLKADAIEGDVIELEDAEVDVVRGHRIVIGPGCRIGLVEYTESLQVNPQAEVREQRNRSRD
ncbi:hypothetical protein [Paenibacillus hubeiensis]|uniref:hypothetical protein n=1 Tax=Paenibacillus hubeiensis TaxID=3077330 RepID=UPI0031BBC7CA